MIILARFGPRPSPSFSPSANPSADEDYGYETMFGGAVEVTLTSVDAGIGTNGIELQVSQFDFGVPLKPTVTAVTRDLI